jgi:hypothetical protein
MPKRRRAAIKAKGQMVIGNYTRSHHDVSATIVYPYANLLDYCHIPHFAGTISFHGDRGDQRIKDLLRDLYTFGTYLESSIEDLRGHLPWNNFRMTMSGPDNKPKEILSRCDKRECRYVPTDRKAFCY